MADDIASLGLSIDSSQAASAATALDKLTTAGQSASDAADQLAVSGAKSETVLRAIQAAADRSGISFDDMNKRVDDANASINDSATANTKAASAVDTHTKAHNNLTPAVHGSSSELSSLDKIAALLESRMLGLGNNLGLFGQILQVIGPGGLAAAAGIGAIIVVVDQLVSSADRMGDLAIQLNNLSAVSGLSTTALQALEKEAVGFGLSATQTGQFLDRFTQQLDGVRKGSGTLYTELLKIDPALLAQISTAKTTTDALNLLAQAYAKAGSSQNALATAAGAGRGSAGGVGQLLGDVATKGSVDNLTSSVNQLDLITQQQTKSWATLKTQIDDASTTAKNNIASIYTGSVLSAESSFYDKFLDLSREMKQFSLSSDYQKFIDSLTKDMGSGKTTLFGYLSSLPGQVVGAISNRIASVNARSDLSTTDISGGMTSGTYHPAVAEGPTAPVSASPAVQASEAAAQVSFLGSAATATDKYNASVLKLNAEVTQNATLTGLQGRALAGLALDKNIAQVTLYNSALGDFATTQDLVNAKTLSLAKAQQQGAGLTQTQTAAILLETAANNDWSRATQSAQLGVFNLASAQKTANDQLQVAIDKKLLDPNNPEQYAAAMQAAANKVQALGDSAKVAGSAFPQLQQLALDAGNVNKQFDTFATTSANAITPALEGIMNGTTTASQGFKNLGLAIVTALENAIIQLTIIKPLLNSVLGTSGGGLLSVLGIGGGTGAVAANGSIVGAVGATSVGGAPLVFAAADGGTFGPGWGVVGEKGPELIKVHNGGVTVIPNHISKPYLPGFADGGSLSSGGMVSRLPGMGQDNSPGGGGGGQHVTVGVSVDNDGNLQAYVKNVSQQTTTTGVQNFATSPAFVDHVAKATRTGRQQRKM